MTRSAAASVTSPFDPDDFPDWVDPMLVKELRQGMQARMFVGPFIGVQILAVITILAEWSLLGALQAPDPVWGASLAAEGVFFWALTWILLGVIFPLRGLIAMEDDGDRANLELVLMTRLSRWRIVTGKWLVLCAQSWLVLVSLLPYFLARYFLGQLDVGRNLFLLLLVVGVNAAACAVVVGASTYRGRLARTLIGTGGLGVLLLTIALPGAFGVWFIGQAGGGPRGSVAASIFVFLSILVLLGYLALYTLYGLQLGRCRIRARIQPDANAPSGVLLSLIFFTPIIMLIASAFCPPVGGLAAMVVLGLMARQLEPWRRPPPPAARFPAGAGGSGQGA